MVSRTEKRMDKMQERVGDRIREVRLRRGMSQDQLGDITGLHPSHVGEVERGESNVTFRTLFLISRALKVPMVEFIRDIK